MPSQPSLLLGPRLEGWHLANVTPGHPGVPVTAPSMHPVIHVPQEKIGLVLVGLGLLFTMKSQISLERTAIFLLLF